VAYVDYFNVAPYQDFEVITKPAKQKVYIQIPRQSTSTDGPGQQNGGDEAYGEEESAHISLTPYSVTTSRGMIAVNYSSTYIYVTSVRPAPGCTYEGGRSGVFIETTFKCPSGETQVQLWLSGGRIQQKIE
jgi:hypothetical protein